MSEFAYFPRPQTALTAPRPEAFLGAVSPLWGYYMAAAAGGVAYWWMTRWTRPENLEAFFQPAARATGAALTVVADNTASLAAARAPLEAGESMQQAAQTVSETASAAEALLEPVLPEIPVGGEAAPISPLLEVAPTPAAGKEGRSRLRPPASDPDTV
ncbi:hypothetical protein [Phenylobacterium deserti]|uniref:Uncharacterized protein n=1 Tax=Phenylobacterium deserti TaxID=1914756 RepID=A0A328ABF4_9CAUL|nr:hypothetical protein [Phenylobacterium deserti]RAK50694.1 hypothetical protein DJ018_18250 [Phenylobacterium deserti]